MRYMRNKRKKCNLCLELAHLELRNYGFPGRGFMRQVQRFQSRDRYSLLRNVRQNWIGLQ